MRRPGGRTALVCVLLITWAALSTPILSATIEDDLDDAWGSDTFGSTPCKVNKEEVDILEEPAVATKAVQQEKVLRPKLRPFGDVMKELRVKDFAYEICVLAGIVLYIVNMVIGARTNRQIANRWCMMFGIGNGILPQQFAHVGIGKEGEERVDLSKESASKFKYYASGRRFVEGMLVTLDLRARQDIIMGYLLNMLLPQDDLIDFEIHMKEDAMPQTVLSIATVKLSREMLRREDCYEDLKLYTRKVDVTRDKIPGWPHDKLTVLAEQSSVFYDLMTPELLEQVFGKEAFAKVGKYFRALRFTCEGEGKHKLVAQFSFALPPAEQMGELLPWMQAAMHMLDLLGSYKLKPDQKAKALKAREKAVVDAAKDDEDEVQRKREERDAAKRKEEKEKMKRMGPAEREKYQAKKDKLERERRARKMGKTMFK
ncbi:g3236 [Coccomyxa viridis]|uniref:G3236 protein n=1 Tax=Coccomyxa viridis TaxID=1274662 RepID=A0ABP1FMA2_9CHLO